jgi:hypothetical protein
MSDLWTGLLALPSPLPQVHVVLEPPVRYIVEHAPSWWPPTLGDVLTFFLGLTTIFLGIAALATIIANDVGLQQRLMPVCDLEDIDEPVAWRPIQGETTWSVQFGFSLTNNGGGPAREVKLTLEQYGDQRDDERGFLDEVYLGAISPGERRPMRKPFRLPLREQGYEQGEAFILVLRYEWLRDGSGEAYIEDRFDPPRPAARPRTTLPPIVLRGPQWLLAAMKVIGIRFS